MASHAYPFIPRHRLVHTSATPTPTPSLVHIAPLDDLPLQQFPWACISRVRGCVFVEQVLPRGGRGELGRSGTHGREGWGASVTKQQSTSPRSPHQDPYCPGCHTEAGIPTRAPGTTCWGRHMPRPLCITVSPRTAWGTYPRTPRPSPTCRRCSIGASTRRPCQRMARRSRRWNNALGRWH